MTGYLWTVLAVISGMTFTAIGDLVSEEIRGWLDLLPHTILRLAAARLSPDQQAAIYEDEWLPELTYILGGAEARPITRLMRGLTYSVGLLAAARRVSRHIDRTITATPPEIKRILTAISTGTVKITSKPVFYVNGDPSRIIFADYRDGHQDQYSEEDWLPIETALASQTLPRLRDITHR